MHALEPLTDPIQFLQGLNLHEPVDLRWEFVCEIMHTDLEKPHISQGDSRIQQGSLKKDNLFAQPLPWEYKTDIVFRNGFRNVP